MQELSEAASGWLGTTFAAVAAFVSGLFMSRANIMNAVTKRIDTHIGHLESEIGRLTAEREADRARCDEELAELRVHIETLMGGAIPGYELGPSRRIR